MPGAVVHDVDSQTDFSRVSATFQSVVDSIEPLTTDRAHAPMDDIVERMGANNV